MSFCESGLQSPHTKKRNPNNQSIEDGIDLLEGQQDDDNIEFQSNSWVSLEKIMASSTTEEVNNVIVPNTQPKTVIKPNFSAFTNSSSKNDQSFKCNCDCSKVSSSHVAFISFDEDRIKCCQCSCHSTPLQEIEDCDCDCKAIMNSLPMAIAECECLCHHLDIDDEVLVTESVTAQCDCDCHDGNKGANTGDAWATASPMRHCDICKCYLDQGMELEFANFDENHGEDGQHFTLPPTSSCNH